MKSAPAGTAPPRPRPMWVALWPTPSTPAVTTRWPRWASARSSCRTGRPSPATSPQLADPISDYTFAQIYSWRNSLHLAWRHCRGHLCVFANGCGDLTLLLPPIGDTGTDRALADAADLMDTYNAAAGVGTNRTRVEYCSDELLARLSTTAVASATPMGTDYVYDTARMIDLAGGDLASKRQAKNRFVRTYAHRVETYEPARHLDGCLALLHRWHAHQDLAHAAEPTTNSVKRQKESTATELALRTSAELGLTGMIVTVDDAIAGFTLGEPLGGGQSSIVIEKTDLAAKGLAQFIFSEFCRLHWAERPRCNVGDDWGLESLAWTKQSYRPVRLLAKHTLVPARQTAVAPTPAVRIRSAVDADLSAAAALESACFSADLSLAVRPLRYLLHRDSAVFAVADAGGAIVGTAIALVRPTGPVPSGRIVSLAVDAAHRGHRLGRRLLDEVVDRLAARGVGRVFLEVDAANGAAIALYERAGFVTTHTLDDYYGPGRTGLHMARDLRPATLRLAA